MAALRLGKVEMREGLAIDLHHTVCWVIEPGHELSQGGLSTSCSANDRQRLSGFKVKVDSVQGADSRVGIGESYTLKSDAALDVRRGICGVDDLGNDIQEGVDARLARSGFLNQRRHPSY